MMKKIALIGLSFSGLSLVACSQMTPSEHQTHSLGMANPASKYCIEQGGTLLPQKDAQGNEFSLCKLPNGQTIEEWDLFRKDHPVPKTQ